MISDRGERLLPLSERLGRVRLVIKNNQWSNYTTPRYDWYLANVDKPKRGQNSCPLLQRTAWVVLLCAGRTVEL